MAADLGVLQRLPKICANDSVAREIAFTARDLTAVEAEKLGVVSEVHPTQEETLKRALDLAASIAARSPVAVQGTKVVMNFSRDHSTQDSLAFTLAWQQAMLQSEDVQIAVGALISKDKNPKFANL